MGFAKFKSRPVEIEAVRFVRANYGDFAGLPGVSLNVGGKADSENWFSVRTSEGVMRGNHGDWLIRGTEGELYPCKASVFERKYE